MNFDYFLHDRTRGGGLDREIVCSRGSSFRNNYFVRHTDWLGYIRRIPARQVKQSGDHCVLSLPPKSRCLKRERNPRIQHFCLRCCAARAISQLPQRHSVPEDRNLGSTGKQQFNLVNFATVTLYARMVVLVVSIPDYLAPPWASLGGTFYARFRSAADRFTSGKWALA
jgi:hypothetical protein